MTQVLIKKIQGMRDGYEETEQYLFDQWIENLESAEALKGLRNHLGITKFLDLLAARIKNNENILTNKKSKDLPDKERDLLIVTNELYREFINFFDVNRQIETIEKNITYLEKRDNIQFPQYEPQSV